MTIVREMEFMSIDIGKLKNIIQKLGGLKIYLEERNEFQNI